MMSGIDFLSKVRHQWKEQIGPTKWSGLIRLELDMNEKNKKTFCVKSDHFHCNNCKGAKRCMEIVLIFLKNSPFGANGSFWA